MVKIATAGCSVGPVYLWRNVSATSRFGPQDAGGGPFLKMGARLGSGGGRIYVLHNTILQPPGESRDGVIGCGEALAQSGGVELGTVISRDNILLGRRARSACVRDRSRAAGSSYDYDLFNGVIQASPGQETHGIHGSPIFRPRPAKGDFSLAPESPGLDAALPLPNFNDGFTGKAPDVGAHEAGSPPMEFGVEAYLRSQRDAPR